MAGFDAGHWRIKDRLCFTHHIDVRLAADAIASVLASAVP
jgi:hypothetical protein